MQIYKLNFSIFGLVLLLVFLRVPAERSVVTLNSVTELLTEIKYRLALFEFENNLGRWLRNVQDNEFAFLEQVDATYLDNMTLKFFEPLYDILDASKTQIHGAVTELRAKIEHPESNYMKITNQGINRDWEKLSTDATLIIQSTKDLNSVLESIQKHIALNKNTVNHVISDLQTISELVYSASQDLGQARKRLEQISTESSKILIKHPRSNHMLIESILEEQKNLQIDRQELMVNCNEYGKVIDIIAEEFRFTDKKLEHILRTVEQFQQENNTAIRMRENFRAEISELSIILLNNKKEIQELRKQREIRHNITKEIVALQQEIGNTKLISTGDEGGDTLLKNVLQEISDLRFVTNEEIKKLIHFTEEMKCTATLQPSSSENATITLTLLQSGMCSRE